MLSKIISYFSQNFSSIAQAFGQHIEISVVAVGAACIVGVPFGILCARSKPVRSFITGVFSTLRIIPSLAVLFLCVSLMGSVGLWPTVLALALLAIPPILINTTLAFAGIDAAVLETAKGMGMGSVRTFFQVKVPLAAPLIIAGLKTATVEVIASATLGAYIGAGGLGTIIFTGLGLLRSDILMVGGALVALLSLTASFFIGWAEKRLLRWHYVTGVG